MKFLKKASNGRSSFYAEFHSGAVTMSNDAATFFMKIQDKDATLDEVYGYISMGKMVDPSHDWKEIERISKTFTVAIPS